LDLAITKRRKTKTKLKLTIKYLNPLNCKNEKKEIKTIS